MRAARAAWGSRSRTRPRGRHTDPSKCSGAPFSVVGRPSSAASLTGCVFATSRATQSPTTICTGAARAAIVRRTIAALAPVQIVVGDWVARDVAKTQPVTPAALEAFRRPRRARPTLLGWYDGHEVEYGIEIPKLLSLLAFHRSECDGAGLDTVPVSDRPRVNVVRFSFQTMVAIGTAPAPCWASSSSGPWFRRLRRLPNTRCWFYRAAVVLAGAGLPVVALLARWSSDGGGRRALVLYRVMRTWTSADASGSGGLRDAQHRLRRARGRRRLAPAATRARRWNWRGQVLRGSAREGRMDLAEAPVVLMLVGLAAYAVLGGADFGAGLWHPGRPQRTRYGTARACASRNGAGLGGQPRLADLRARRLLDGVPGGLRVDQLDTRRSALHRRHRHHPPRPAYALRSGAASPGGPRGRSASPARRNPPLPSRSAPSSAGSPRDACQVGDGEGDLGSTGSTRPRWPRRDRHRDVGVPGGRLLAPTRSRPQPDLEGRVRRRALGMAVVTARPSWVGRRPQPRPADWDGLTSGAGRRRRDPLGPRRRAATIAFVLGRRATGPRA